ncbi:hypothetical protein BC834DRAFT_980153 [Gloeopeniophorella convolvens]|nr:hypothetical protein BC834DRAFT_980153 [Gloeopeniophorella convolvens]
MAAQVQRQAFTRISPDLSAHNSSSVPSHSALPDNTVDHGHVDPNGQSLDQALDPHLSQVALDSRSHYHSHYPAPHIIAPDHAGAPHHPDHMSFYSAQPHDMSVQQVDRQPPATASASSSKRKQLDSPYSHAPGKKRRPDGYDDDADDADPAEDGGAGGARHWTDDEKTKLFSWLMGPNEDEHFDALRTKKNTCFRDCALDAFGGRKTFLAVKGCYERNFVVFKQIYAFETFTAGMQQTDIEAESEVDRLREYERRIYAARKAGFHVGNLSSRILDHWHRMGWYATFHSRWHGDPNVRRPPARARPMGPPALPLPHAPPGGGGSGGGGGGGGGEPPQAEPALRSEDASPVLERAQADPSPVPHFERAPYEQLGYAPAPDPGEAIPPSPPQTPSSAVHAHALASYGGGGGGGGGGAPTPTTPVGGGGSGGGDGAMAQTLVSACMRLLQAQADDSKVRLEYLRRREEREEADARVRMEMEKKRLEREAADAERLQLNAKMRQKSELATELLSNPNVDPSVKAAAGDYLKKLFAND